ncbi:DUF5082 domain-containing protein [Shouchella clausii]|jgi:prefoldin subunit 5|uniref:DUF5082 domain-containing protein n=1 Tax=Shouchella clausii TaxID=79880 RepID=A0A268S1Z2_SHOCL|nr:DUF5082 domain-containing protein [Shouchella clausii]AST95122.1 DUF5082 domain-containing protein [Shouchella clausii]MBU8595647.1 DUF5082 domain-containing protein [Shouchella clausii]MCR1287403.1 DUF5082 domain-containing protein [Shouchella clausii]MEB5474625.1 DUF5082 domain-containing protein [Shouchella clausii]MEB5479807.1 DUF5082 domain-containing protein [Shouchella clausii]
MDYSMSIQRLQQEMSSLRGDIVTAQQDVQRLQETKSTLIEEQNILHQDKTYLQDPELSYDAWRGNEANDHDGKRFYLETSYQHSQDHLEDIISSIETKISDLQSSIENSYRLIDAKQAQVSMFKRLQKQ